MVTSLLPSFVIAKGFTWRMAGVYIKSCDDVKSGVINSNNIVTGRNRPLECYRCCRTREHSPRHFQ